MNGLRRTIFKLLTAVGLLLGGSASAIMPVPPRAPGYLGTWTISGSQPAPWRASGNPFEAAEAKRLAGVHIMFARDRITGPAPLACRRPHYDMHGYSNDMLFQGSLTAPRQQAMALGFTTLKVWTLETGCEGMIDFHFVDTNTAMFALNSRLYTIRRIVR